VKNVPDLVAAPDQSLAKPPALMFVVTNKRGRLGFGLLSLWQGPTSWQCRAACATGYEASLHVRPRNLFSLSSCWACKLRCLLWLCGNEIPISLLLLLLFYSRYRSYKVLEPEATGYKSL